MCCETLEITASHNTLKQDRCRLTSLRAKGPINMVRSAGCMERIAAGLD